MAKKSNGNGGDTRDLLIQIIDQLRSMDGRLGGIEREMKLFRLSWLGGHLDHAPITRFSRGPKTLLLGNTWLCAR